MAEESDLRRVALAYLAGVLAARTTKDVEELLGVQTMTALLARAKPETIRVKHRNGRVSSYSRTGMQLKDKVLKSQRN